MKTNKQVFAAVVLGLLLLCLPAMAQFLHFDTTIFTEDSFYEAEIDDMEDKVTITPQNLLDFASTTDQGDMVSIYPIIKTFDEKEAPTLAFFTMLVGDEPAQVNRIIFTIGKERRYILDEIESSEYESEEWKWEGALFPFGKTGYELIEDMSTAKEVKVKIEGRVKNNDYVISKKMIEGMAKVYEDFALAGGVNNLYGYNYEEIYPIKVESLTGGSNKAEAETEGNVEEKADQIRAYKEGTQENDVQEEAAVKKEEPQQTQSSTPVETAYIGNKKSKKFHRPSCANLPAEQNQVSFETREEAIAQGYDPCGGCNP